MAQDVYLLQDEKLRKLEQELDCSHTKMQSVLENFKDRGEKVMIIIIIIFVIIFHYMSTINDDSHVFRCMN